MHIHLCYLLDETDLTIQAMRTSEGNNSVSVYISLYLHTNNYILLLGWGNFAKLEAIGEKVKKVKDRANITWKHIYLRTDNSLDICVELAPVPRLAPATVPNPALNLSKLNLPPCDELLRLLLDSASGDAMITFAFSSSESRSITQATSNSAVTDMSDTPIPKLHAHRCILTARAPVFKTMLDASMIEGQSDSIIITDISYEVMREVLRFLYTNKFTRDMDTVLDDIGEAILYAAHKYEVTGLVGLCEMHFIRRVAVENALFMRQLASKYNLTGLTAAVDAYIAKHSEEIMLGVVAETEAK